MRELLKQLKTEMREGMRLEITFSSHPVDTEDKQTFLIKFVDVNEMKIAQAEITFQLVDQAAAADIVCKEIITDFILQLNRITG